MATPAPARTTRNDAWQLAKARFLEDLDHAERLLFQNATLENIYYSTSNISRDDAENSKTRAVIQKLGPLVSAIESYGKAVDTIAQIAPLYLLPIWGSIRVLLVVASAHGKFYNQIVDTLSRIGDILPRFRKSTTVTHEHGQRFCGTLQQSAELFFSVQLSSDIFERLLKSTR
jgi:hypothetical protein